MRTLEANSASFGIIAKSEEDDIFLTKYSDKVLSVRTSVQLEMDDLSTAIEKVQKTIQADEYVIAPSTEALNRFLLKNRKSFEELKCLVPLVDETIYEKVSDKFSFGELCEKNNILIPSEGNEVEALKPPFVAKPKTYFAASGQIYSPVLIFNQTDKDQFLANYTKDDFYYQEYIEGQSLYLLYYFYENGDFEKFSQKNLDSAVAGELVFSLLIRRRDVDVWNRSYTKEGIPVFYDLSACLDFEEDLQDVTSFFAKKGYGYAGSWRVREWDNDELPNAAILRKASDHNIYVKNSDTFKYEVEIMCSLLRQRLEQINLRELLLRLGVTEEKAAELENYLKSTSMTLHNDVNIMLETALSD